ncbi:hypothetical protein [Streptomyces griseochromogenes]|uniref:hypothetical protein n=1 Tax=Streptomyces griseochromogenes TaxID=68214 RepID=UPI0037B8D8D6
MKQLMFRDDPAFWFETLRNLGLAAYGGSDVGEVIATTSRVTPGDYDGWHDAWLATAQRLETEARGGHPISARDGLLRASSYYRAAEFFLHGNPDDPRIDHAYKRGVACFRDAITQLPDVTPVEIPYEDTVLRGYFYRATGTGPKPTLVMHNGFDGAAEELHFFGALGGQERGYNVLTFDGPGQTWPSTGTGWPSGRTGRTWSVPSWTSSSGTRASIRAASRCSASASAATSRPARPPTSRAWRPSWPSTVSSTPSPP